MARVQADPLRRAELAVRPQAIGEFIAAQEKKFAAMMFPAQRQPETAYPPPCDAQRSPRSHRCLNLTRVGGSFCLPESLLIQSAALYFTTSR